MSEDLRVAFLGPEGSNTHAAALALFDGSARAGAPAPAFQAETTIRGVFEAVAAGRAERGVVPIENSTEGGVAPTLDALFELSPVICAEYVAEIHHFLLGRGALDPSRIRQVLSHPQALAQCQGWLAAHLPEAELVPMASTSAAAREVARDPTRVAIASELAAQLYGLDVLASHIEDRSHNATRFVALALEDAPPTGSDKTSLVFTTRHERGALRRVLGVLDDAGLNLTRIESRPLPERRWEYAFFTDVEGSRHDTTLARALSELDTVCGTVKVLGSYPRADLAALPGRLG